MCFVCVCVCVCVWGGGGGGGSGSSGAGAASTTAVASLTSACSPFLFSAFPTFLPSCLPLFLRMCTRVCRLRHQRQRVEPEPSQLRDVTQAERLTRRLGSDCLRHACRVRSSREHRPRPVHFPFSIFYFPFSVACLICFSLGPTQCSWFRTTIYHSKGPICVIIDTNCGVPLDCNTSCVVPNTYTCTAVCNRSGRPP